MSVKEIIYEVNLEVDVEVLDTFVPWLEEHIEQMLTFDGFKSSEVLTDEENEEEGSQRKHYTVQYRLENRASLNSYFENHAAAMRGDGMNRFGGKFSATRRILESQYKKVKN